MFSANLAEPLKPGETDAAQGKFERAGSTLMRFTLNSTVGCCRHLRCGCRPGVRTRGPRILGQTLAEWGVGGEPFLMLPLLGTDQSPRRVGLRGRLVRGSLQLYSAGRGRARPQRVTSGVSQRAQYLEELETLEATSVDYYAALRELYRQYRATEDQGRCAAARDGNPRLRLR